jgi:hypothetical protein
MNKEFEILETEMEISDTTVLPYLYIALLEYCSEITGDSIKDIDKHIAKTVGLYGTTGTNFPRGDKLDG